MFKLKAGPPWGLNLENDKIHPRRQILTSGEEERTEQEDDGGRRMSRVDCLFGFFVFLPEEIVENRFYCPFLQTCVNCVFWSF